MTLTELRKKFSKFQSEYVHAKKTMKEEGLKLQVSLDKVSDLTEAQKVIQLVAQGVQEDAHTKLTSIVTRCIRAVFDDPYEFRIDFERKRGKTEAVLTFVRGGNKTDPLDGTGGGVLDVAAFALQIACIVLQKPRRRRLFVTDEPFKFVSERSGYRDRIRDVIEKLSEELGFQFVMVTHDRLLEIGRVFEIR